MKEQPKTNGIMARYILYECSEDFEGCKYYEPSPDDGDLCAHQSCTGIIYCACDEAIKDFCKENNIGGKE